MPNNKRALSPLGFETPDSELLGRKLQTGGVGTVYVPPRGPTAIAPIPWRCHGNHAANPCKGIGHGRPAAECGNLRHTRTGISVLQGPTEPTQSKIGHCKGLTALYALRSTRWIILGHPH
jgi:hypothetical protein